MNTKPFRVLRLDDVENIPGPGSLMWKPIRFELGVRAFGCNAYSADEAGHDVVEPHTEEDGSEHEELYFVARGAATFKVDDETIEAEAGTYIFVPDPKSRREAIAKEAGTVVLAFGGPPEFSPSAWEWSFRAGPLIRSNPAGAREILEEGRSEHPQSASILYSLACLEAQEGHTDEAVAALREAVEQDPEVATWAKSDDDLKPLHELDGYKQIVGA
jgi:tetratricopeptide (TPR) repeat protein